MSVVNANVSAGKVFVPDAAGQVLLMPADLNRIGVPTVSVNLSDKIAAEDLKASAVTAAKLADEVADRIQRASIGVGASVAAGSAIVAQIQILDAQGNNLAAKCVVRWWISDANSASSAALVPCATKPTSHSYVAGGAVIAMDDNVTALGVTDATGLLGLSFTNSGAKTAYVYASVGGRLVAGSRALVWS